MLLGARRLFLSEILSGSYFLKGLSGATVSSVISGPQALNKFGPATVNLSALNTFTGPISIHGGTLVLTGSGSLTAGSYSGAIGILGTSNFNFASSATQTLSGVISGTGNLNQSGSSALTLTGTNTYSGVTTVYSGSIVANAATSLGVSNIVLNGGTLTTSVAWTLGATQTITIGTAGGTVYNTSGTYNHAIILGTTNQLVGSGTLTITATSGQGDAISVRAAQTTFTGNINIVSGRLEVTTTATGTGGAYLLGSGAITISGGTLAFGADSGSTGVNTITNNITIAGAGDGTGSLHAKSTGNTTFSGTITLTAACQFGNDQSGAGNMIYAGVISGAYAITTGAGKHYFDNSSNSFSSVIISSAVTIGGSGKIPGNVTIPNAANSILIAGDGNGNPGTLTLGGNLTFAGTTSSLSVLSNGTTTLGVVNVTGTCALGGCKVNLLSVCSAGTYTLISATGTMSGTLPTIGTNSSGRTPTFAQVSNNLQVTLV